MKLELFNSKDGWRIRLKGGNGKIIMSSEAYSSYWAMRKSVLRIQSLIYHHTIIKIVVKEENPQDIG